jgi:predicted TIM-barrel fold metal-dependent hydrolase
MVGVDTYSLSRWHDYAKVAERIRQWTKQLPEDTASRLTHKNAAAIYDGSNRSRQKPNE